MHLFFGSIDFQYMFLLPVALGCVASGSIAIPTLVFSLISPTAIFACCDSHPSFHYRLGLLHHHLGPFDRSHSHYLLPIGHLILDQMRSQVQYSVGLCSMVKPLPLPVRYQTGILPHW
ncbi:hypothetical protein ACQKWADRAFT_82577 [Trichoderma austrokoningii]